MISVGRICLKIAGREAGQKCVVVEVVDKTYVTIDGNVRRKRCSISHLEPLQETVELKKGASHDDVVSAFRKLGILVTPKRVKRSQKKTTSVSEKKKPSRKRKVKKSEPSSTEKQESKK